MVKGVESNKVIAVLNKISKTKRNKVKVVTLDMAATMERIASILFKYYPDLKIAYDLCRELGSIYTHIKHKGIAFAKLAQWYNKLETYGFKTFNTVSKTIQNHYINILNYFDNRYTNASAESFNAKIKAFRSQFRGVRSIPFFLYRFSKIYA